MELVAKPLHFVLRIFIVLLLIFLIFFVNLLSDRQLEGLVQDRIDPATALHLNRVIHKSVGAKYVLQGHASSALRRVRRLQVLDADCCRFQTLELLRLEYGR